MMEMVYLLPKTEALSLIAIEDAIIGVDATLSKDKTLGGVLAIWVNLVGR